MFDMRAIRQEPQSFDANWSRRGLEPQTPAILAQDEKRRAVQTELQDLQQQRNEKSKAIGKIKSQGGDAQAIMDEVAAIKDKMAGLEDKERVLGEELNGLLSSLPNMLAEDVPQGKDEADNKEIPERTWGDPKDFAGKAKEHYEIGEALGMMDFETAAKMSGSRFVLMQGGLARMERALAQFMLDTHTGEHGYREVSPPLLVRDNALYGTGQLPKFTEDLFSGGEKIYLDNTITKEEFVERRLKTYGTVSDEKVVEKLKARAAEIYENLSYGNHWLIPTAEVSLTNIVADMIIDGDEEFPRRYTAFTPCFRSEAGAAGKDTRGMIRQHQFYKVEMVSVTTPEQSGDEHERMTQCAETILQKLELPYRTVVLCSGDTGFGAMKTYDIEVWLPGQNQYREISSCSNCGDFQARRMKARYRRKGEKDTHFVHTLNGSGVAVGRALIAVLENYYDPADGGVFVPKVLKPYMGGLEKLLPFSSEVENRQVASG